MAVKRRTPKRRHVTDDEEEKWLRAEPCGFIRFIDEELLAELWQDHSERILAEHVAEWPGTRPRRWWQYDAPEQLAVDETETAYLERYDSKSGVDRAAKRLQRLSPSHGLIESETSGLGPP
jgi:hypothetical protein